MKLTELIESDLLEELDSISQEYFNKVKVFKKGCYECFVKNIEITKDEYKGEVQKKFVLTLEIACGEWSGKVIRWTRLLKSTEKMTLRERKKEIRNLLFDMGYDTFDFLECKSINEFQREINLLDVGSIPTRYYFNIEPWEKNPNKFNVEYVSHTTYFQDSYNSMPIETEIKREIIDMFVLFMRKEDEDNFEIEVQDNNGNHVVINNDRALLLEAFNRVKGQICITNITKPNKLKALLLGYKLTDIRPKYKEMTGEEREFAKKRYDNMFEQINAFNVIRYYVNGEDCNTLADYLHYMKGLEGTNSLQYDLKARYELYNECGLDLEEAFSEPWYKLIPKLLKAGTKQLTFDSNDKWDFHPNLSYVPDDIKEFYENTTAEMHVTRSHRILNCDVNCTFSGLSGTINNYKKDGLFLYIDVKSFFPSFAVSQGYISRNVDPEIFKQVVKDYYKEKKAWQKAVLVQSVGQMRTDYSLLRDEQNWYNIIINSQLAMLELLHNLEGTVTQLVEVKTDGAILELPTNQESLEKTLEICKNWESKWGLTLKYSAFTHCQHDKQNNYYMKNSMTNKVMKRGVVK